MASIWDKMRANWANQPGGTKLQSVLGAAQLATGALLPSGSRPKMRTPGAVNEATDIARMQAMQTVRPGNDYAISQINRNAGRSISALNRSLGSGQQILAGVSQIQQNTNQALAENNAQNSLFRFNATQNLQNSLARLGNYQYQNQRTNELDPYLTRQQTKNMLVGAGIQNISGAANTSDEMAMYEKVFGAGSPNKFFSENPGTGAFDKPLFQMPQSRNSSFMGASRRGTKGYGAQGAGLPNFDEDFQFRPQFRF